MHKWHYEICGVNLDVGLHRRLQRLVVFWPVMLKRSREIARLILLFLQTR